MCVLASSQSLRSRLSFAHTKSPVLPLLSPVSSSAAVINRYFELRLTRSGFGPVTDPIPFDAVAMGSDEVPATTTLSSLVTCENADGSHFAECDQQRLQNSGSMQMKVRFGWDRIEAGCGAIAEEERPR